MDSQWTPNGLPLDSQWIDQVGLTGPGLGVTWAGRVPGPSAAIATGLQQVSGPSGPGTTTATIPHKIP